LRYIRRLAIGELPLNELLLWLWLCIARRLLLRLCGLLDEYRLLLRLLFEFYRRRG
jgi:hypothetical protein